MSDSGGVDGAQVGGSKISSKITVIESLMNVCDKVILGGGMIFTFFRAEGKSVGSSLVEEDKIELAKNLAELAKKKGVELILPVDVIAADKFAPDANVQTCSASSIPDGESCGRTSWSGVSWVGVVDSK